MHEYLAIYYDECIVNVDVTLGIFTAICSTFYVSRVECDAEFYSFTGVSGEQLSTLLAMWLRGLINSVVFL